MWEYKELYRSGGLWYYREGEPGQSLESLGAEGWEMCGCWEDLMGTVWAFFKQRIIVFAN
jgi:hypothetical protein